jgi:DNA-binding response OmpR family regulator
MRAITILVVDGERNLRTTLALILQDAGYSVTTAANAKDALQCLKNTAYDLLFLDIQLPDTDGLVFLFTIRNVYPNLPLLVLTACPNPEIACKVIQAGVKDYLVKPVAPTKIINRVNKILTRLPPHIS